jgi:hypothetical protein
MKSLYEIWRENKINIPFLVREPITGTQIIIHKYEWQTEKFIGEISGYFPKVYIRMGAHGKDWRFVAELFHQDELFKNQTSENVKRVNFSA